MLDETIIGWEGEPFELDVERGKIREFARAIDAALPEYVEGEQPLSPPTFLTTMFAWAQGDSDPLRAVDWDRGRSLHAEQEFVFQGPPPRAGIRLVGQTRVETVFRKRGRRRGELTFVVLLTEFRDPQGGVVAASRATIVETEAKPTPAGGEQTGARPPGSSGPATSAGPTRSTGEGRDLLVWTKGPITRTDIVVYEGAAVIFNPIHHDEHAALAAGYPAPISVGMFQAGLLGGYAARNLGPERVRRLAVRFHSPVLPDDTLEFRGRVTQQAGVHLVDLLCTNTTGSTVLTGTAEFVDGG